MDDEYQQDPYTWSVQMRGDAPAHPVITANGLQAWLISRYAEAKEALTDPRLSKDYRGFAAVFDNKASSDGPRPDLIGALQGHMLNMDPPDHTRLRKLVVKAFTPRRTEALRPRVEQITAQLLDSMAEQSEVDLLDAFAFPLPIQVISELLGVPHENKDQFPGVVECAALRRRLGGRAGVGARDDRVPHGVDRPEAGEPW
jgi:cytochrome P450